MKPMSREELRQIAEAEVERREIVIRRIVKNIYMDVLQSAKKNRTRVECFAWWDNTKLHTSVSVHSRNVVKESWTKMPFWGYRDTITFEQSYVNEILHQLRHLFPECSVTYKTDTWRWDTSSKTSGKNGVTITVSW